MVDLATYRRVYSQVYADELDQRLVLRGLLNNWYEPVAGNAYSVRITKPSLSLTPTSADMANNDPKDDFPDIVEGDADATDMSLNKIVQSDVYMPYHDLRLTPTDMQAYLARRQGRAHAETIDTELANWLLGSTTATRGVITLSNSQADSANRGNWGNSTNYADENGGAPTLATASYATEFDFWAGVLRKIRNDAVEQNMLVVGDRRTPVSVYMPWSIGLRFEDSLVDNKTSEALVNRFAGNPAPQGYIGTMFNMDLYIINLGDTRKFNNGSKNVIPIFAGSNEWASFALADAENQVSSGRVTVMESGTAKVKHGTAMFMKQRYGRLTTNSDAGFIQLVRAEA